MRSDTATLNENILSGISAGFTLALKHLKMPGKNRPLPRVSKCETA